MTNATQDLKPGAVLGAERESKGWTIEYIGDQINLNKNVIIALEADDYEALPPPAFVRGYIRAYAKLLEIDSDPLVAKYEQVETIVADMVASSTPEDSITSDPLIRMVSGVFVAVVLGVLAYWWYNNKFVEEPDLGASPEATESSEEGVQQPSEPDSNEPDSSVPESVSPSEPVAAAGTQLATGVSYERPADLTDANPSGLPAVDVPVAAVLQNNPVIQTLSKQALALENVPETIEAAVELTQSASAANSEKIDVDVATDDDNALAAASPKELATQAEPKSVAEGTDTLLLKTTSESWVSVIDAAENRLMYGILTSGTPRKLQGLAPFNVVLGADPDIEATLNGSNVDFASLIRKSNTARFVIEQTGKTHR